MLHQLVEIYFLKKSSKNGKKTLDIESKDHNTMNTIQHKQEGHIQTYQPPINIDKHTFRGAQEY